MGRERTVPRPWSWAIRPHQDLKHQAALGLRWHQVHRFLSTRDFERMGAAHSRKYPGCSLHPLLQVRSLVQQHLGTWKLVKNVDCGVSVVAQRKGIRLVSMRMQVRSLASLRGLRIQGCHKLWCRLAAKAPIGPLAWEPPYGCGPKKTKDQKKVL